MTTPRLHWKKVCASACSIDHSSTASLCTSTVPEYLLEQQTRTVVQRPHIPDPPPSRNTTNAAAAAATPPPPWPPKYSHVVRCERVTWPAQVHLFCADCFKGFCLHRQKSGGDNFLEFSLGLPLWRFAHSWLALSLTLSLRKGWYLRGLIYSEEFR